MSRHGVLTFCASEEVKAAPLTSWKKREDFHPFTQKKKEERNRILMIRMQNHKREQTVLSCQKVPKLSLSGLVWGVICQSLIFNDTVEVGVVGCWYTISHFDKLLTSNGKHVLTRKSLCWKWLKQFHGTPWNINIPFSSLFKEPKLSTS